MAKGAASKVGKKKVIYMRNPDMTMCGRMMIVYKMMLNCRSRNSPPTAVLIKRVAALNIDLTKFDTLTQRGLRKEVYKMEWLKKEAKERAAAAGNKD